MAPAGSQPAAPNHKSQASTVSGDCHQQQIVLDDYHRDLQGHTPVIGSDPEVLVLTRSFIVTSGSTELITCITCARPIRCRLELRVSFSLKVLLSIMLDKNNIAKQYSGGSENPWTPPRSTRLPGDTDRRPRFTPPPSARKHPNEREANRLREAAKAQVSGQISARAARSGAANFSGFGVHVPDGALSSGQALRPCLTFSSAHGSPCSLRAGPHPSPRPDSNHQLMA